jgi:hypothetical protein
MYLNFERFGPNLNHCRVRSWGWPGVADAGLSAIHYAAAIIEKLCARMSSGLDQSVQHFVPDDRAGEPAGTGYYDAVPGERPVTLDRLAIE